MSEQCIRNSNDLEVEPLSTRSSRSGSARSVSTATWERQEQEAEALFVSRVQKLCQYLWPAKNTRDRLLSSGLVKKLRTNQLLRFLVPDPHVPLIKRLRDGDLNHITGITLPSGSGEIERNLILRVTRWDQRTLSRDVAILNYVRQKTRIPVPTIAAIDTSCNNPLEKPYVLQHLVLGSDLRASWDNLCHQQRYEIAAQIGQVYHTLLQLEHPKVGLLDEMTATPGGTSSFKVVPFDLDLPEDEKEPDLDTAAYSGSTINQQTAVDLFRFQMNRWRAVALSQSCGRIDNEVKLWDQLLQVVHDMDDIGLFKGSPNCLCHVDLHPGNIMVQTHAGDSINITAILDWDEAVIAPKFVACTPPAWLWADDYENQVDENGDDPWPYELAGAGVTPLTLEKQEIKQIFEENAGAEFYLLAYDEISRLRRTLFRIAKEGLSDGMFWSAGERILREWASLRGSLTKAPR